MVGSFIDKISFISVSIEEETSSAGEQLVSNKMDGYTVNKKVEAIVSTFLCATSSVVKKNSKPQAFHMQ